MWRLVGSIWVAAAAIAWGKPNVLFIAIDDLNGCVGALGDQQAQTPHIDRLAARGALFTNAHCAVPACNPSRTAILTGLRASTSGVYLNQQDWREEPRLKGIATLPGFFREQGYKVVGGGKIYHAHSLTDEAHSGFFDPEPWEQYFPSKSLAMPLETDPPNYPVFGNPKFYRGHFDWVPMTIDDAEMADAKVVSWAETQLSEVHDQPLFLAVGVYRPHVPWWTPKKYFDIYPLDQIQLPAMPADDLDDIPPAGRAMAREHWQQWVVDNGQWRQALQGYLASVSFADAMVGRLIEALEAGPMRDDTVVVLWSDHGYHLGHKQHWEKFALWRQATQVPLIFAGPEIGVAEIGSPASLLDVYPTLCDLAGLEKPEHLEGRSLADLIGQRALEPEIERYAIVTHGFQNHAVQSQDYRYIRYHDGSEELYHHPSDPHEFDNLATESEWADVKAKLRAELPKINVLGPRKVVRKP